MAHRHITAHLWQLGLSLLITLFLNTSSLANHAAATLWVQQALQLQRDIDKDAPLNEATFIGTHNSYNARAYQNTTPRYMDPNQIISITEQLDQGIRSVELDVHWTTALQGKHLAHELLLCHARGNHTGCSIYDRPLIEALTEMRYWLLAHPHEVILVYLEHFLNGHEPRLAHQLNQYLGAFLYTPNHVDPTRTPNRCLSLPSQLSKNSVLKAGKQVILIVKGCVGMGTQEDQTQFPERLADVVFTGSGNIHNNPYTFIDAKIDKFFGFPDCAQTVFDHDRDHTSLWRIFEDRTILSNIGHKQRKLLPADMRELMRCGINWPTMDMLQTNDERLVTAIWSWAPNYPQPQLGNCAIYHYNEGIKNVPCDTPRHGFACYAVKTQSMQVLNVTDTPDTGNDLCRKVAGPGFTFAMPINGKQLQWIREAMQSAHVQETWLNYQFRDGQWTVGGH